MRVGIAINPASGRGRGTSYGEEARKIIAEYPVDIVDLSGADSSECLSRCKASVAHGDIDALVAVGGDGMVHLGVDAVAGSGVPLGIIAVGSGNDNAREFRLPIRKVDDAAHQVMSCLFGGRSRPTDVMEIRGAHGTTHALAILSAGIDADVNLRTNALSWPKGNLRYVRALVESIIDYPEYGIRVEIDGKVCEGPATLISVANTRFFGGGINIAPMARTDDGMLDVIVGYAKKRRRLAPILPWIYTGQQANSSIVHCLRAREVRISHAPQYGAPPPIGMADGEIIGDLPLTIRCLPGGLELLI
ncbi:diacylglycerol kinase [Arcanobacterium haemolyticum]|nr:diacylglycerol kinase [Arcanobacterium haemolyticum]